MEMYVREKLVELLNEVQETGVNEIPAGFGYTSEYVENEKVASHLIANGTTVQECKLGDKKTNADRIRSMSDEELKKFICSMFKCEFCDFELGERCGLLNWLQMPAEDDE